MSSKTYMINTKENNKKTHHQTEKYRDYSDDDHRVNAVEDHDWNEIDDDWLDEDEYPSEEEEVEHSGPKRNRTITRSIRIRAPKMTEQEILQKIAREITPLFRVDTPEEIAKCNPSYYCSNKFLGQMCEKDWNFAKSCKIKLELNGGERGMLAGQIKGTCQIIYYGCDASTIKREFLPQPSTTTSKPTPTKAAPSSPAQKSPLKIDDLFGKDDKNSLSDLFGEEPKQSVSHSKPKNLFKENRISPRNKDKSD